MRVLAALIIFLGFSAGSGVQAGGDGLRALDTGTLGRGWEAVGRIDIGRRGFCTGAMITQQLVLTAAHCLFDKDTGARLPDSDLQFRAGLRNGRSEADRSIRRSAVHPEYRHMGNGTVRVAHDLALLELDRPIQLSTVQPFAVYSEPRRGDEVGVVSYARGRSEVPSLEERCNVLERDRQGVVSMSCSVDFGASGAPVFAISQGQVRIVSVISAMSTPSDPAQSRVALGVSLGARLDVLRAALAAGDQRFIRVQDVPSDGQRQMSSGGGARFVRP